MTKETRSTVTTMRTERSKTCYLVREWNAVKNMSERFAVKVAIKTNDDNVSMKVLDLALCKEYEVVKELRLVDDNKIDVLCYFVGNLHKVGICGVAGYADPIVGYNIRFEGITSIIAWFDDEDTRPDTAVALDSGRNKGGLSGKHGTDDDFETHCMHHFRINETESVFTERFYDSNTMQDLDIQTGGDALYGGAVRVLRRGRRGGGNSIGKTYTIVSMVATILYGTSTEVGEFSIPNDTFKKENADNCQELKNAWASAVKANFSAPTVETIQVLETTQLAFAKCLYGAIQRGKDSGNDDQKANAKGLVDMGEEDALEYLNDAISFIVGISVGYAPVPSSSMVGGSGFGPSLRELQQTTLPGQLAIAQGAVGGPAEAPSEAYLLAKAAFRMFLSPFVACGREVPTLTSIRERMDGVSTVVEDSKLLRPSVGIALGAAGLLVPGLAGSALGGVANTMDAVNAVIPGAFGIVANAAATAPMMGRLAVSAASLGANVATAYIASRAVGALTSTGAACAKTVVEQGVETVGKLASSVESAIVGAPAAAPAALGRAGDAIRGAFRNIGGRRQAAVDRIADANASAVNSVLAAPDAPAAVAAAEAGAVAVGAAMREANAALPVSDQVAPEGAEARIAETQSVVGSRLGLLATSVGAKRGRSSMSESKESDEEEDLPPAAKRPAVSDAVVPPTTGGGCPMCGGSRKKRKSKKSRKQKRRASYRRSRKVSKSRSPSEEKYASPPVPEAIVSPHMESSGPPVRS